MTLSNVNDKVRVVLASAVTTNQLKCVVLFNNSSTPAVPKGRMLLDTNNTTAVDLLAGLQGTTSLTITQITIYNKDTVASTVSVSYYNGTDDFILTKQTLQPGETLQYNQSEGFFLGSAEVNAINNLINRNNGTFDAFYRQRFSEPFTIFDNKQINDKQPLFWDDQLVSGAGGASTYNTNQASTTLTVALNTAAVRVRQTFKHFNYQPGKSHLIIQTGIFGAAGTGVKRKSGLFNSNNGIFFDQQSDGMGVTIRTFTSGSAVDTRVLQANWNIDKLNGTGASGITLDFTKTLIWFFDFEWLGVGTVRWGFFIGGKPVYCHEVNNSNESTLVYMSTPNLPIRHEIENTGTGAAVGFTQICNTVVSEGGVSETGFPFGFSRGAVPLTTNNNTSIYPLIAIRLKTGYLGSKISIGKFSIVCTSTSAFNYYWILNPTVVGTALNLVDVTNSSVQAQVDTTNATTLTGGTVIHTGGGQATNENGISDVLNSDFTLGSTIAGVSDILVLAVQRVTGTTETFYGSVNIKDKK